MPAIVAKVSRILGPLGLRKLLPPPSAYPFVTEP